MSEKSLGDAPEHSSVATTEPAGSLIERLQAATEGDGNLSWAVAEHIGWTKYWNSLTIYLPPGEIENDPRQGSLDWTSGARCYPHSFPEFTTNIDAALSLVPGGWDWAVKTWGTRGAVDSFYASTFEAGAGKHGKSYSFAPTAAVALCIAALKARHTSQTSPPKGT